jgi:hypothetical protein
VNVSMWKVVTEDGNKVLGDGRYTRKFFGSEQEARAYVDEQRQAVDLRFYAIEKFTLPLTKDTLLYLLNQSAGSDSHVVWEDLVPGFVGHGAQAVWNA